MKQAMTKNLDTHADDNNSQPHKTCSQGIAGEFPRKGGAGIRPIKNKILYR